MFDSNLMFSNAQVVGADAYSTNAIEIGKTPADGVWIEVVVTAKGALVTALTVQVLQKSTDAGWLFSDVTQQLGTLDIAGAAVGRYFIRVQSKKAFLKLYYDITLTGNDVTVTAGIVSGPQRDTAA